MYLLTDELYFPPDFETHSSGIIAIGGDLSVERLMLAYQNGIFPWFEDGEPITWWCPDWRMVLVPSLFQPSKSLRAVIRKGIFRVTFNTSFKEVIVNCQQVKRKGQNGTWITEDMINAYCRLHALGCAKSIEVWCDDNLVGGLYGVDLGHVFCGESMFSKMTDASKVAFVYLVEYLKENNYTLLDCQVYNEHLESLGCFEIPRKDFIGILKNDL